MIGTLIFITFGVVNDTPEMADNVIIVSAERVLQLQSQFESTWKRPPTDRELDTLIEGHIREEVYYRGALALALDRNDAVVRRRMHQKMEFLIDTGSYLE
ncbi:MAG: peptidyl-prolyl cis-trans isomerase, partial [Gammaproteobacteria bacterium]|nr:peptidyl-prolyl cis-trans isomerase [Gammaproteobacteria bacterium]